MWQDKRPENVPQLFDQFQLSEHSCSARWNKTKSNQRSPQTDVSFENLDWSILATKTVIVWKGLLVADSEGWGGVTNRLIHPHKPTGRSEYNWASESQGSSRCLVSSPGNHSPDHIELLWLRQNICNWKWWHVPWMANPHAVLHKGNCSQRYKLSLRISWRGNL